MAKFFDECSSAISLFVGLTTTRIRLLKGKMPRTWKAFSSPGALRIGFLPRWTIKDVLGEDSDFIFLSWLIPRLSVSHKILNHPASYPQEMAFEPSLEQASFLSLTF